MAPTLSSQQFITMNTEVFVSGYPLMVFRYWSCSEHLHCAGTTCFWDRACSLLLRVTTQGRCWHVQHVLSVVGKETQKDFTNGYKFLLGMNLSTAKAWSTLPCPYFQIFPSFCFSISLHTLPILPSLELDNSQFFWCTGNSNISRFVFLLC